MTHNLSPKLLVSQHFYSPLLASLFRATSLTTAAKETKR